MTVGSEPRLGVGERLDPATVARLRAEEFPLASRRVFLNHAQESPLPARSAAAVAARIAVLQDPPLEVGQREALATASRAGVGRLRLFKRTLFGNRHVSIQLFAVLGDALQIRARQFGT